MVYTTLLRKIRTGNNMLSFFRFIFSNKKRGIRIGKGFKGYRPDWADGIIEIGNNVAIGRFAHFSITKSQDSSKTLVSIGKNTKIRDFFQLACNRRISIGKNVLIANRVFVGDGDHQYRNIKIPIVNNRTSSVITQKYRPVIIGDDSWIGTGACILKNVQIGNHCVVGANSVVTKDVLSNMIVAGVPAKVIKKKWDDDDGRQL